MHLYLIDIRPRREAVRFTNPSPFRLLFHLELPTFQSVPFSSFAPVPPPATEILKPEKTY